MSKFKKMKLIDLEDNGEDKCEIAKKDLNDQVHSLMKTIISDTGDKKGSIKKFRKIIQSLNKDENCVVISRKSLTPPTKSKIKSSSLTDKELKWEIY